MKSFTFDVLPKSAADMTSDAKFDRQDPFCVAAFSVAAFCRYMEDEAAGIEMLDALKGPEPLSVMEKQFLKDRVQSGYTYVPKSYFAGAVPQNNYTPDRPFTISVSDNPYSYPEGEMKVARLLIKSGGADTERFITMRQKISTGEWFLHDWQGILAGIRVPVADDPWA